MTRAASIRTLAVEQRILAILTDGPKTCNEVSAALIAESREAWADRHGYSIEWGTAQEPLGARLLAWHEAEENGCFYLVGHEVYRFVRRLERAGRVSRLSIDGHRPILWLRTADV